ncbi:MAG: 3-dehydroquinate synthase II [Candidatus Hydrothermarchaeales archaeon]
MKFFFVDCTLGRSWNKRKMLLTAALESGAKGALVLEKDLEKAAKLGTIKLIVDAGEDPKSSLEKGATALLVGRDGEGDATLDLPSDLMDSVDLGRLKKLKNTGTDLCGYVEIHSKKHERLAALEAKATDSVIVVGKDWTVIPLENLIAELQKEDVEVIAGVRDLEEARLALETLEKGSDGVLLQTDGINEIKKVSELIQKSGEKLTLKKATIKTLKPVGMGDRVCVDTASLLNVGEGMLIGSQANGLFMVHSESIETEYVAARPFRVNAGAVHAYVLAPDKKTNYLSEVKAGDEVLAVDTEGNVRSVIVGRVKIEKRPLILVEAECDGKIYKTLLQNAETIMLVAGSGKPISISKLKEGDEVLIFLKEIGRHFGMEVEESIIER